MAITTLPSACRDLDNRSVTQWTRLSGDRQRLTTRLRNFPIPQRSGEVLLLPPCLLFSVPLKAWVRGLLSKDNDFINDSDEEDASYDSQGPVALDPAGDFEAFCDSLAQKRVQANEVEEDLNELPLWGLRVKAGREFQLAKQIRRAARATYVFFEIKDAFAVRKSPGWIYIRSKSESLVLKLCERMVGIFKTSIILIPTEEHSSLFAEFGDKELEVATWVKIVRGIYKYNFGIVLSSSKSKSTTTVLLVPRFRQPSGKRKRGRPLRKLLTRDDLRISLFNHLATSSLSSADKETNQKRFMASIEDTSGGFKFDGEYYTTLGFIVRDYAPSELQVTQPRPGDVQEFIDAGIPFSARFLNVGDIVRVLSGKHARNLARVLTKGRDGTVRVALVDEYLQTGSIFTVLNELDVIREFKEGDGVVARLGSNTGKSGIVIRTIGSMLLVKEYETNEEFELQSAFAETDLPSVPSSAPTRVLAEPKGVVAGGTLVYVFDGSLAGKLGFLREIKEMSALVDMGADGLHWLWRDILITEDNRNLCNESSPKFDDDKVRSAFELYQAAPPTDVIALEMVNETVYVLRGPHKGKLGVVKGVAAKDALVAFESVLAGARPQQIARSDLLSKTIFDLNGDRPEGYTDEKKEEFSCLFERTVFQRERTPPTQVDEVEESDETEENTPFHDPIKEGMWVFDPLVAAHRSTHKLSVELLGHPDPKVKYGWICRAEGEIPMHPLASSFPPKLPIEYKTSHGASCVEEYAVKLIRPRTKTNALHLAVKGNKKGQFFRHIRTKDGKARVYPKGSENRKDVTEIDANHLCEVDEILKRNRGVSSARDKKKVDKIWQTVLDRLLVPRAYRFNAFPSLPRLIVLLSEESVNRALLCLRARSPPFIALDIEERPIEDKETRHTDLVQLRDESTIYLVHLAAMGMARDRMPVQLRELLEDGEILKIANHVRGDGCRLYRSHGCNIRGAVELSQVAIHVDPTAWPLHVSRARRLSNPRFWVKPPAYQNDNTRALEAMSVLYLRRVLSKEAQVSMWHLPLTEKMKLYAANDVDATFRVFIQLSHKPQFATVKRDAYIMDYIEDRARFRGTTRKWKAAGHPNHP
ncbi:hypothetical protein SCHPADRAFT_946075 [Schizopora paradoxa]|uniref:Chromatin elongation factor SPT5 n=1 Tax=Schizopora paradoxa TaxID=27342 RepID=A0A0H2RAF1_9AGAM|nr:hypothetical protein SCHPADRAFT_946075 [Schizopora paradoxa]